MNYNILMGLLCITFGTAEWLFQRRVHSWGITNQNLLFKLRNNFWAKIGGPSLIISGVLYLVRIWL